MVALGSGREGGRRGSSSPFTRGKEGKHTHTRPERWELGIVYDATSIDPTGPLGGV